MGEAERLKLIHDAATDLHSKWGECVGLLESIMWLAGDLSQAQGFTDSEILAYLKDKECFRGDEEG